MADMTAIIIRQDVLRGRELINSIMTERNGTNLVPYMQGLEQVLRSIEIANEARDMLDLSESTCRALLEIGCDVGIAAALDELLKSEVRTLPTEHVENPFRRESTHMREAVDAVKDGYRDAQKSCCTCPHNPSGAVPAMSLSCPVHGSSIIVPPGRSS